VQRAGDTNSRNSDVSVLAEAAALIEVFIESALRRNNRAAALILAIVNLVIGTS